jgi:hypothetical protein
MVLTEGSSKAAATTFRDKYLRPKTATMITTEKRDFRQLGIRFKPLSDNKTYQADASCYSDTNVVENSELQVLTVAPFLFTRYKHLES